MVFVYRLVWSEILLSRVFGPFHRYLIIPIPADQHYCILLGVVEACNSEKAVCIQVTVKGVEPAYIIRICAPQYPRPDTIPLVEPSLADS